MVKLISLSNFPCIGDKGFAPAFTLIQFIPKNHCACWHIIDSSPVRVPRELIEEALQHVCPYLRLISQWQVGQSEPEHCAKERTEEGKNWQQLQYNAINNGFAQARPLLPPFARIDPAALQFSRSYRKG